MFGFRENGKRNEEAERYISECSLWLDMYRGHYPWCSADGKTPLGLAATIADELARTAAVEAEVRIQCADRCVTEAMEKITGRLRSLIGLACAGGGTAFVCSRGGKDGDRIHITAYDAAHFIPMERDRSGEITKALFVSDRRENGRRFSMYEYHIREDEGIRICRYCMENPVTPCVYDPFDREQTKGASLCPLTEVSAWSDLEPVSYYPGAVRPMFVYMPVNEGCFDRDGFSAGGSVYCRAVGLIREADLQFNRLIWEFEGGELAIDASEDMFRRTRFGFRLPAGKERLFRTNILTSLESEPMRVFSPALRDRSYADGLDIILSRIEDVTGLSRGTVSTLRYTDRTATEIRDSKQRLYATVCDIQKSVRAAMVSLALSAHECGRLHGLCGSEEPRTEVIFNDSVVEDASVERVRDAGEFAAGLISRDEFRRKWGMTSEDTR